MRFRLHPLNSEFHWRPTRGPFRRITTRQAQQYDEEGFFVLEDVFDARTVEELIAEIDPFEAQAEERMRSMKDGEAFIARAGEITFTSHLVKRSRRMREFCCSEVFQDLGHDLIGPDVRLYWD